MLLEGAGLERRLGLVELFGLVDFRDLKRGCLQGIAHGVGFGLGLGLELGPVVFGQGGLEFLCGVGRTLRAQVGGDFPVFLGDEAPDLAFAVGDQPDRDRLDAPGTQVSAPDFFPEERAELVADHAVEEPPRLLGVDHIHVDRAGLAECILDGPFGDFVERHPANAVFLQVERLLQVPGDGFAFAVGVGRQIDQPGTGGGAFQVADRFLLGRHDLVGWLVAFGHLEAELPFGKIAHVAHAGLDHIS